MNKQIYSGLANSYDVNYIGPINPPVNKFKWVKSKLERLFGLKGDFFFYSEERLTAISEEIQQGILENSRTNFFHGLTAWSGFKSELPYYCYVDASFPTYLKYYVDGNAFRKSDIQRILVKEKTFLTGANKVLFSSAWALEETKKAYNLSGENFEKVGLGGNLQGEPEFKSPKDISILFVALDFHGKGGWTVVKIFKSLVQKYPDSKLVIIGEKPPRKVQEIPGITFLGKLNKNNKKEFKSFQQTVKSSTCLVHPTNKDITPLTVVECGLLGTPALSSHKFGIPEMIPSEKVGFTITDWNDHKDILRKILAIHSNDNIRRSTYEHFSNNFNWSAVLNKIKNHLEHEVIV